MAPVKDEIDDRPQWVEIDMLNKLERKLRAELGSPAPAPTPKKDEPPPKKEAPPAKTDDDPQPVSPTP